MNVHLIAIGGAAMHNIALALYYNHHTVTGSDDEIYNPAKDRLSKHGLLPERMGWYPEKITKELDFIILGMHARKDNPELERAVELGIPVYSYPAFIYKHAENKKRVVIAGSHGKTTTTSMIMHVLKYYKVDYDYLVGAQLEGFDTMVKLSDAPLMIIEGDEYLSSPIDRRPKILHYKPHISILTGIAWDHINVFPTFQNYVEQFEKYVKTIESNGKLFYFQDDTEIQKIVKKKHRFQKTPYEAFDSSLKNNKTNVKSDSGKNYSLKIFGQHNLQNLRAAYLVCKEVGIKEDQFFKAIKSFKGAAKRLQTLYNKNTTNAYLDFAHAPSKVKATVSAMKEQFEDRTLIACLELHTFSSLNKKFLKEYRGAMDKSDRAFVFFNEHTLKMKRLPPITKAQIEKAFGHKNLSVITDNKKLLNALKRFKWDNKNLLMMTSGTFNGLDLKKEIKKMINDD